MTLRRVARPRLLDSHCLLENSRGCFREIALFPILLFFRFALRFWHVESCHRSTLREILKFKLTHYRILAYPTRAVHVIFLMFEPKTVKRFTVNSQFSIRD
jgi:hypothetical protein